jgi:uncharacterized membrane protein
MIITEPVPAEESGGLPRPGETRTRAFEVWPHRSLGPRGTRGLLIGVGMALFLVAARHPAPVVWAVAAACLAAFGGLAFALWVNNRSARLVERIVIGPCAVRVVRSRPTKQAEIAEFNTAWVRVVVSDERLVSKRLVLTESGRSISVGEFLSPEERVQLADAVRASLAELRVAVFAEPAGAPPAQEERTLTGIKI